jgi:hypothetical protein
MRSDYVAEKVSEMKLNYPPGMHRRTIEEMDGDAVESRMLGLPGELQLDKLTADKYFGGPARDKFFDRYQWLSNQRCIINSRPDDGLQHLYFENEKLDNAKLVPFGPLRGKRGPPNAGSGVEDASLAGSQVSAGSGGSAFRSRFKASGSDAGSVQHSDARMLRESAMRSGVRKQDFEDDLAHPDDAIVFGEAVSVTTPRNSTAAQQRSALAAHEEGDSGSEDGDEWDNVSEVTMAEADISRLQKKGFYKTDNKKKFTFEDHPSNLKAQTSAPVSPSKGGKSKAATGAAQPQQTGVQLQAPPTGKRATFENTVDAAVNKAQAAKGGTGADSAQKPGAAPPAAAASKLMKTGSQGSLKSSAATALPAPIPVYSKPAFPNNPHGSLRIQYLTPGAGEVPQTNATAFNGRLNLTGGVAGTSIPANTSPEAKRGGHVDGGNSSTAILKLPPSGSKRPQTAGSRTRASFSTAATLSAASSRVTTPRKGETGESASVNSGTARPSTAKVSSSPSAAANRKQLLSAAASLVTPSASNKSGGTKAPTRAQRIAARAASVSTAAVSTTDTYSKIILEDLLAKKNVRVELDDEQSATGSASKGSIKARLNVHDDDSLCTASTVSTVGLGLYLDGLRGKEQTQSNVVVPITSPRTKYLAGCMREGLNPRASLVLRKNMSKALNLQHHGMGDQMGRLLAESIQGLPHIQSINIADNMLTDVGMGPIILAAVGIPGLLELNLSQNEIGPVSAKALFEYLSKYPVKRWYKCLVGDVLTISVVFHCCACSLADVPPGAADPAQR